MAVSTLPIWVYLSIVGLILIFVLPQMNYHLSSMSKLRARCLKNKSEEQRNNSVIKLEKRIDERYYPLIVLGVYMVFSIGFYVNNHEILLDGNYVILRVLLVLAAWLFFALVAVVFGTGLMRILQERAMRDLERYYERQFHVTVMYLDKIDFEKYYDYKTPEL